MEIVFKDVIKRLSPTFTLKIPSLALREGEKIAVVGPTGSGKTTFLSLLAALDEIDSGIITIDGLSYSDSAAMRKVRESIRMVFQFPERQLFERTVEREINYSIRRSGKREAVRERVLLAMDQMRLSRDRIDKSPFVLSGGEKRKTVIASVIIGEAPFLLFDEPIAGLDPESREDLLSYFSLLKAEKRTVLMVTHNSEAAITMDRILVFKDGLLSYDGTPHDYYINVNDGLMECPEVLSIARELGLRPTIDRDELIKEIMERTKNE